MSELFFYFSPEKTGGWKSAPASQRSQVIADKQPKYVTVLDLSELIEDDAALEDTLKIRYRGPFYADWDCESIEDGAASVNRWLDLLESEYEVDIACVRLYATGGRGFHAELPFAVFNAAKSEEVQYLPYIYKEMAYALYTDDMDLAVYSGKRGRMWRTPNVEREKAGHYKVPITAEEMRAMTVEKYEEICSAPRPEPVWGQPSLSAQMAALFVDLRKKIEQRFRERKNRKNDDSIVKRMHGEWPDSVKALMSGQNINTDAGLNKIALQLGILSCALGKSLDDHLEACDGLIRTYKGDGHATRRAVREELKRMYRYADSNAFYTYSPSAMAAIMDTPQLAKDLNGPAAPSEGQSLDDMSDLSRGTILGTNGIYSMRDDKLYRETNWHYDAETATEIKDAETGQPRGFIIQMKDSGRPTKETNIDHGTFISGDKFRSFLAANGAVAPKMDTQKSGAILAMLMQHSRQNGTVYAVSKEGFNLIGDELVWCSPLGCWANNSDTSYRFRSSTGSEGGNFQSDIMSAPLIGEFPTAPDVIDALLNFNANDYTVAAMLGWFIACWHKPLHIEYGHSFPILQAYGESGAGKTEMSLLLLHLFYYHAHPKAINASQGSAYGRRVMFSGSTTIPMMVDEFKPTKMSIEAVRDFRMLIHEIYNPSFQAPRGGGDARSSNPGNWAEISFETKTTPVVFTTESAETETAIQERTISVPFSKLAREGKATDAFKLLTRSKDVISAIGKLVLHATAGAKREALKTLIERSQSVAEEHLSRSGNSRIVYNIGVALSGLGFLGQVLRHTMPAEYKDRFEARLETLHAALLNADNHPALQSAPEIVKILRFMQTVSYQDAEDADHNVRLGTEYTYTKNLDLDIAVDAFYLRYRTAANRRSQAPTFSDSDAFYAALRSSSLMQEVMPPDTTLNRDAHAPRVVRLSGVALDEYGLGKFGK